MAKATAQVMQCLHRQAPTPAGCMQQGRVCQPLMLSFCCHPPPQPEPPLIPFFRTLAAGCRHGDCKLLHSSSEQPRLLWLRKRCRQRSVGRAAGMSARTCCAKLTTVLRGRKLVLLPLISCTLLLCPPLLQQMQPPVPLPALSPRHLHRAAAQGPRQQLKPSRLRSPKTFRMQLPQVGRRFPGRDTWVIVAVAGRQLQLNCHSCSRSSCTREPSVCEAGPGVEGRTAVCFFASSQHHPTCVAAAGQPTPLVLPVPLPLPHPSSATHAS